MGFSLGKLGNIATAGLLGGSMGGSLAALSGSGLFSQPQIGGGQDILGMLSQDYYNQTQPLRSSLINRSQNFLSGGLDVTQSPMYGALKSGIEGQYGTARNNIMSSLPQGGALIESLVNLEGQKAGSLAQGIGSLAQDELNRAYGLGTGAAGQALQGLGSSAGIQAQLELARAQQRRGAMQGLGAGLGSLLGFLL